jgi:galactofuranose transport system ATP-binding protein
VVIRDGETVAQLDGAQMSEASIMDAIAYGAGEQSTLAEAVEDAKHDR